MIISPPFIRAKNNNENDAHWIERMMPVEPDRDYPINYGGSWHGGIHVRHTNSDRQPEYVRAIADGVVVSIRNPSDQAACSLPPLNYNGSTDDGYVLLRHETEIGTGEDGCIDSREVRKKPGGYWIIRDLTGLDLVGLASL